MGALVLAARLVAAADKDNDGTVSRQEWTALADDWFQKLDTGNTGKVTRADFVAHFNSLLPPLDDASSRPGIEAGSAMAGVQHADRRLLQIPLARSATDLCQDR